MRRTTPIPTGLKLDLQTSEGPLYQRVYEAVRAAILTGQLQPGTTLPAGQTLAEEMGISRMPVLQAYDMLLSEGYILSVPGSRTLVADNLPEEFLASPPAATAAGRPLTLDTLSDRGMSMLATQPSAWTERPYVKQAFDTGEFASDLFPVELWSKLSRRCFRGDTHAWLDHGEPAGYYPLREALSGYLESARSVRCTPGQVIIFSGLASAITFIAQILTDPGDPVWIERFCQAQTFATLELAKARIVPVPVDDDGLDVEAGIMAEPHARLVFVSPAAHVPLGMTLPMPRRLALLQWARERSAWVIESDHNGEFRYRGRPLPSLQGLDQYGRTIYLGTFARTLFPGIRLAYAVVPESLVTRFVQARALFDMYSPVFEQMVIAEFIGEGHFQRHIRRLRRQHAERQQVLLDAAADQLDGLLEMPRQDAGMFSVGWLPKGISEADAVTAASRAGVQVQGLSSYCYGEPRRGYRPGLVLNSTDFEPDEIRDGVIRLALALRSLVPCDVPMSPPTIDALTGQSK